MKYMSKSFSLRYLFILPLALSSLVFNSQVRAGNWPEPESIEGQFLSQSTAVRGDLRVVGPSTFIKLLKESASKYLASDAVNFTGRDHETIVTKLFVRYFGALIPNFINHQEFRDGHYTDLQVYIDQMLSAVKPGPTANGESVRPLPYLQVKFQKKLVEALLAKIRPEMLQGTQAFDDPNLKLLNLAAYALRDRSESLAAALSWSAMYEDIQSGNGAIFLRYGPFDFSRDKSPIDLDPARKSKPIVLTFAERVGARISGNPRYYAAQHIYGPGAKSPLRSEQDLTAEALGRRIRFQLGNPLGRALTNLLQSMTSLSTTPTEADFYALEVKGKNVEALLPRSLNFHQTDSKDGSEASVAAFRYRNAQAVAQLELIRDTTKRLDDGFQEIRRQLILVDPTGRLLLTVGKIWASIADKLHTHVNQSQPHFWEAREVQKLNPNWAPTGDLSYAFTRESASVLAFNQEILQVVQKTWVSGIETQIRTAIDTSPDLKTFLDLYERILTQVEKEFPEELNPLRMGALQKLDSLIHKSYAALIQKPIQSDRDVETWVRLRKLLSNPSDFLIFTETALKQINLIAPKTRLSDTALVRLFDASYSTMHPYFQSPSKGPEMTANVREGLALLKASQLFYDVATKTGGGTVSRTALAVAASNHCTLALAQLNADQTGDAFSTFVRELPREVVVRIPLPAGGRGFRQ